MKSVVVRVLWRTKFGEWLGDLGIALREKQLEKMFSQTGLFITKAEYTAIPEQFINDGVEAKSKLD